ncbi:LysR substrate-binding domain-containing protein [Roseibium polysiphoniae]|uniref:LysR family transcriptional regulator n=1 Tax=Roseibium polysiphoniae TaxID=2571221 RepID=A0ABR9CDK8_9HYPH|nr:LysR substrate-binding domain-containing protein [Roseibium polysiphoniae]MBD8877965.1 LysR family transcriptional regulator [Roseibium polysiphoniae]
MDTLDSDLLRTFVAVTQAGSISDGAARIRRSQSATSLQIKRLEAILGKPVFDRHGRGVVLSETGRRLLPIAQEVTDRLDAALRDIARECVTGKLRVGIPDDHGRAKLAQIIATFSRQHPQVELDVSCALSAVFPNALQKGALDLAIYEVNLPAANEEVLFEDPTCWAASKNSAFTTCEILPVALFDQACWWRNAAISSLEERGKPYRIVYTSQSVSGVVAAVDAGIAVGLLGRSSLHSGLSIESERLGLQTSPTSKLVMAASGLPEDRPLAAMKSAIRAAFQTVT